MPFLYLQFVLADIIEGRLNLNTFRLLARVHSWEKYNMVTNLSIQPSSNIWQSHSLNSCQTLSRWWWDTISHNCLRRKLTYSAFPSNISWKQLIDSPGECSSKIHEVKWLGVSRNESIFSLYVESKFPLVGVWNYQNSNYPHFFFPNNFNFFHWKHWSSLHSTNNDETVMHLWWLLICIPHDCPQLVRSSSFWSR